MRANNPPLCRVKRESMVVYIPASWPTKLARINTEASFSAKDPWNQESRTTFTIDNYLLVYYFAKPGDIKVKPGQLESMGGYRRVIRSKTDGIPRRLPESLVELWNSKQVPSEALPFLLHEISPMLKTSDYSLLLHNRKRKLAILIYSLFVPFFLAAFVLFLIRDEGADTLSNALVAVTSACGIGGFWLLLDYLFYTPKRRRSRQMAWLLDRYRTMQPESPAVATPIITQNPERDARASSSSRDVTGSVRVPSKTQTSRTPRVNIEYALDPPPPENRIVRGGRMLINPRKPRAHIVYEVETDGVLISRELPFVVGVLGDFSGDPSQRIPPLSDREFIQIDVDNFNQVMTLIGPGLNMRLENTLAGDGSEMARGISRQSRMAVTTEAAAVTTFTRASAP